MAWQNQRDTRWLFSSQEDHLRKMIDNHLLKEEDIADRAKVARIVQKLLNPKADIHCSSRNVCFGP